MITRSFLKTASIFSFSLAFLLSSVTIPFLSRAGADAQIEFTKQVKQEGDADYKSDITITDTSKPVIFRIYVFNPTPTTYTGGLLRDEFPFDQTGSVKNRSLLDTDQTPLVVSEARINLPVNKKLIYREGSSRVFSFNDTEGVAIPDINGLSPLITPHGLRINKIRGGDTQFQHWYVFQADIVSSSVPTPKPDPSAEMKKEVNNITQNTGFMESVSANKGDVLEFRIWVHNGIVGSTAEDVIVKDFLPITEGKSFVNKAFVSGDNFDALSASASVSTSFLARLEYIPGTTRTFVHADKSDGELISDINGQSRLFSKGVSLEDIKGCFEFERFITFQVKVIKPEVLAAKTGAVSTLPDTGPGLGLIALFGSIPAGLALRKFKKKI